MYQEGHEIGNHSWSHPKLTTLSPEQIRDQVDLTQVAVANAGVPAPTLLRPPYGDINDMVQANIPLTIALWNADPMDWDHRKQEELPGLIESQIHPGRVVVLHDTHRPTADSMDTVITNLQKNYKLVTFSELFDLAPGQPGRYYGR
jgi:peptidoglycan-N-acetylglucosamine deacetylase